MFRTTVFSFNNVRIVNQTNHQIGLSTIFELRRKNKIGVAILEIICSLVAIGMIIKIQCILYSILPVLDQKTGKSLDHKIFTVYHPLIDYHEIEKNRVSFIENQHPRFDFAFKFGLVGTILVLCILQLAIIKSFKKILF